MSTPPSATAVMISPDGKIGDIPIDQADNAAKAGFKHAVEMTSPDGKTNGVIPVDQADAAQKAGFKVINGHLPQMQGVPNALTQLRNTFTDTSQALPQTPGSDEEAVREGSMPAIQGMTAVGGAGEIGMGLAGGAKAALKPTVVKSIQESPLLDEFGKAISREVEQIGPSKVQALWGKVAGQATQHGTFLDFPGGQAAEKVILADVLGGGNLHKMLMKVFHSGPAGE